MLIDPCFCFTLLSPPHPLPFLVFSCTKESDSRDFVKKLGCSESMAGCNQGNIAPQGEEVLLEKRYGGIVAKKPLISKDHERAYFDSADWVLGKQGTSPKSKTAVESLKPKLKRTPHHQLPPRRPACTTGDEDGE